MLSFPHAKINLGLNILRKREDGFHDISSCFYPVKLFDALEIIPADTMNLTIRGLEWHESAEDNHCMKAYRALERLYTLPAYSIDLLKKIPVGAGLGGGSADAAFMLTMLNKAAGLNLSFTELEAIAARLGSDCPFFIQAKPVMISGRGERLSPSSVCLNGYYLVLIKPAFQISTAFAYKGVHPKIPSLPLNEALDLPITEWKEHVKNDFETHLFPEYPELSRIKSGLYKKGALYASLSGSGSVVYGIFQREPATHEFQQFGTVMISEA